MSMVRHIRAGGCRDRRGQWPDHMQHAAAPREHVVDRVREHGATERMEVRLLPQHRVSLRDQRLPDVRHRHQGRFVRHRRRARCGSSCTAAARVTSTRRQPDAGKGQKVEETAAASRPTSPTMVWSATSATTPPVSVRSPCRTAATTSTRAPTHPTRTTRTRHPTASPARRTASYEHQGRGPVRAADTTRRRRRSCTARARDRPGRSASRGRCNSRASRPRASSPTQASSTPEAFGGGVRRRVLHRRQRSGAACGHRGPGAPRPREHRQRARQARLERTADRPLSAHLEPRRQQHVWVAADRVPAARRIAR